MTDLIEEARALAAELAGQVPAENDERQVSEKSVAALRSAGLLRLGTPRRYGGSAVSVTTATAVCTELGRENAAASWLVGIAYGGALFASQLPATTRERIWGDDPDTFVCGSAAPTGVAKLGPGGLRLSGRWSYLSGVAHADWVLLGTARPEPDGSASRGMALVEARKVHVEDDWHMAGMRATGSNSVTGQDLAVPLDHLILMSEIEDGIGVTRHPGERRVEFPLSINLPLAGTVLGIAGAALASVVASVAGGRRGRSPLYPLMADDPIERLAVVEADTLIRTASLHLRQATEDLDAAAGRGRRPDPETGWRIRLSGGLAMRSAREAVDRLMNVAGSGAFADGHPMQQLWRDAAVGSRHAALNLETAQDGYGRALLGCSLTAVS